MSIGTAFSARVLDIDAERELERICTTIREQIRSRLHRRGAVVGVSGGIDSAVTCLLCARALGRERVLALFTPEQASASESLELGRRVAEVAGVESRLEPISETLAAMGCYQRQIEAIRTVFADFEAGWPFKIVLPGILGSNRLNVFTLVVQAPDGVERRSRLSAEAYRSLLAATNMKQRTRKQVEYYHADRLHYAVAGTPNLLEYDQGFFVKNGDGAADFKPIAHLYKTQVYTLGALLGVPAEILARPPTTDTFSLPQTQEEFYFALPYQAMDLCLYGRNHRVPAGAVARELGLEAEQVERVYSDIDAKRRTTRYQQLAPLLVEPVDGFHEDM